MTPTIEKDKVFTCDDCEHCKWVDDGECGAWTECDLLNKEIEGDHTLGVLPDCPLDISNKAIIPEDDGIGKIICMPGGF